MVLILLLISYMWGHSLSLKLLWLLRTKNPNAGFPHPLESGPFKRAASQRSQRSQRWQRTIQSSIDLLLILRALVYRKIPSASIPRFNLHSNPLRASGVVTDKSAHYFVVSFVRERLLIPWMISPHRSPLSTTILLPVQSTVIPCGFYFLGLISKPNWPLSSAAFGVLHLCAAFAKSAEGLYPVHLQEHPRLLLQHDFGTSWLVRPCTK